MGESEIMEPARRSQGMWLKSEPSEVQEAEKAEELDPAKVGPLEAAVKLVFWVSQCVGSSHSESSSHCDSRLWNSSSGALPLFAFETSICISVNVIVMTCESYPGSNI